MDKSGWVRLRISNGGSKTPPLFLKTAFASRSYSIYLTDLSRVWSEELDEYAITDRGTSEDNHFGRIDKSNFADLLETVVSTLKQSDDNIHTILPDTDGLILHARLALPEPLDPFSWRFHLGLLPLEGISRQLTLPLLASSYAQTSQIKDLAHSLQEKDKVISKLLDQLDSINVDLTTVFPSITGLRGSRKTIKREQAAKHVPGLRVFDEAEWRSNSRQPEEVSFSIDEVMGNITTHVDVDFLGGVDMDRHDLWWTHLNEAPHPRKAALPAPVESKEDEATETEEDEDDEFQRQATPPHLKNTRPHKHEKLDVVGQSKTSPPVLPLKNDPDDNETTEDEELDTLRKPIKQEPSSQVQIEPSTIPNTSNERPVEEPATSKPRSRFTIGKPNKAQTPGLPPEPEKMITTTSFLEEPLAEKIAPTEPAPVAPKPPRSRFKIGGKKDDAGQSRSATLSRTPDPHAAAERDLNTIQSITSMVKPAVPDKLPPNRTARQESKAVTAPSKPKTPTPEPETADDVAERRRKELKRQLEVKAPTKKKRRL